MGADVHVLAPPPEPYDAVVVWNGELPTVDAIRLLPDLPEGVTSRPNGIFMETEGGEVKLGVVNAVQDRYLQGSCCHHVQKIAGKRPRKCQLWMRLLSGNFREAEKLLIYWLACCDGMFASFKFQSGACLYLLSLVIVSVLHCLKNHL